MVNDLYLDTHRRFVSRFFGVVVTVAEMLGHYVELVALEEDDAATDLVDV